MKPPRAALFFAAVLAVAACTHAPRSSPVSAAVGVTPPRGADIPAAPPAPAPASAVLPEIAKIKTLCLPRALSAAQPIAADWSDKEREKAAFDNYYNGFLDVRGTTDYIACLKKEKAPDAAERLAKAESWLKSSQAMMDSAMAYFPEGKRIVDAQESFSDVDAKTGRRRVTITHQDGSQTIKDNFFPRKL